MKYKGTHIVVKDCNKAFKFYHDLFEAVRFYDRDGNLIEVGEPM